MTPDLTIRERISSIDMVLLVVASLTVDIVKLLTAFTIIVPVLWGLFAGFCLALWLAALEVGFIEKWVWKLGCWALLGVLPGSTTIGTLIIIFGVWADDAAHNRAVRKRLAEQAEAERQVRRVRSARQPERAQSIRA